MLTGGSLFWGHFKSRPFLPRAKFGFEVHGAFFKDWWVGFCKNENWRLTVIPLFPWSKLLYLHVSGIGWGEKNEKLDVFLLSSNALFVTCEKCADLPWMCSACRVWSDVVNCRAVRWGNLKDLWVEKSLHHSLPCADLGPWWSRSSVPPLPSRLFFWEVCSPLKVLYTAGGQRKCHSFQITYLKLI